MSKYVSNMYEHKHIRYTYNVQTIPLHRVATGMNNLFCHLLVVFTKYLCNFDYLIT